MKTPRINLLDMVLGLADTVDLASPVVADHHRRVAYIALRLGLEMRRPDTELHDLILAALLHDIGALSLRQRLDALHFEAVEPRHAESGYRLLRMFPPLAAAAELVRFHHVYWNRGGGKQRDGLAVPRAAHLLHLADRIDAAFVELPAPAQAPEHHFDPLSRRKDIVRRIRAQSGAMFVPEMVDAFLSLAEKEYFWFDLVSADITATVTRHVQPRLINLTDRDAGPLRLFAQIIDFRSPFTATHSAGVAAAAETLARIHGFSEKEVTNIRTAGYLHDLGKLAVPTEILEKPGKLEPWEYSIIKAHAYHTHRVLRRFTELGTIVSWAAFHHERPDGKGYPFRLKGGQLSPGVRIMAVADVFTALTEDRPYRAGMKREQVLSILRKMAGPALDPDITALVKQNYDELTAIRETARKKAAARYRAFRAAE